jgi:hypothetical protein
MQLKHHNAAVDTGASPRANFQATIVQYRMRAVQNAASNGARKKIG